MLKRQSVRSFWLLLILNLWI